MQDTTVACDLLKLQNRITFAHKQFPSFLYQFHSEKNKLQLRIIHLKFRFIFNETLSHLNQSVYAISSKIPVLM